MKLYELPRGSYFKLSNADDDVIYWFGNSDGMYSYCKQGDDVYHFAAWTDVVPVEVN